MLSDQALDALKGGRVAEAETIYRQIISKEPRNFDALHMLGIICSEEGKIDEAERLFSFALSINPNVAQVWYNRANLNYKKRDYESALEDCGQALKCNVNYADAWNGRGHILSELERYDEAIAAYDKALGLQPDLVDAYNGRGNLFVKLKRYPEAIAAYDEALTLKPDLVEAWLGRGNALARMKRYEEAMAAYDRILLLKPNLVEVWNCRGIVFLILKQYDQALDAYNKAIALRPDCVEALYGRAQCHCRQGHVSDAIQDLKKALECGGDRNLIAYLITYELAQLGETQLPTAIPKNFLKSLFDEYADNFDEHLVNKLRYQTPAKIFELIESARPQERMIVLDLGCGTGLMGERLRPIAKTLHGVDLSTKMLKKAEERAVYDELVCSEITEFLSDRIRRYDLVVASDVFVYMGDLTSIFNLVRQALKEDGLFCFSVEAEKGNDFAWSNTGRYTHSREYLQNLAAQHGFLLQTIESAAIRQESGKDVEGYVVMARCA